MVSLLWICALISKIAINIIIKANAGCTFRTIQKCHILRLFLVYTLALQNKYLLFIYIAPIGGNSRARPANNAKCKVHAGIFIGKAILKRRNQDFHIYTSFLRIMQNSKSVQIGEQRATVSLSKLLKSTQSTGDTKTSIAYPSFIHQ